MTSDRPHSDDCFVMAFSAETTEPFLEAHAHHNFMVPIPHFNSWEEFNESLEVLCRKRREQCLREARLHKHGSEYVHGLRLMEPFSMEDGPCAIDDALLLGTIGFDTVKHLHALPHRPPAASADHGTICSFSSRNTSRRLFRRYFSNTP